MPERFEIYIVHKRRYINTLPFLSFPISGTLGCQNGLTCCGGTLTWRCAVPTGVTVDTTCRVEVISRNSDDNDEDTFRDTPPTVDSTTSVAVSHACCTLLSTTNVIKLGRRPVVRPDRWGLYVGYDYTAHAHPCWIAMPAPGRIHAMPADDTAEKNNNKSMRRLEWSTFLARARAGDHKTAVNILHNVNGNSSKPSKKS